MGLSDPKMTKEVTLKCAPLNLKCIKALDLTQVKFQAKMQKISYLCAVFNTGWTYI